MRPRNSIIVVACLAGMTMLLVVYSLFDPAESRYFPRCVFNALTGWQCPGCGSQRAVHALLSGDFAAAWSFNPLFILEIPLLALLAFTGVRPDTMPRLTRFLDSRAFILSLLAIILIFTVCRNVC